MQDTLGADEAAQAEFLDEGKGWADALQERLGALPWWVISVIAHAVLLFLFVTFFTAAEMLASANDLFVTSEFEEPKEDDEVDMDLQRDLFKNPVDAPAEVPIEQPILPHDDPEAEISDHFETDNDMDDATARGDENAFSTVPLGGTGVIGTIGVGGGGPAGVFGFRNGGGRRKCIMRYGGSKASESAVEAALKWLADHQEADGSWTGLKEHGKHTTGRGDSYGNGIDVGITGLATLAFLGAGYTHKSGKYKDNVGRALEFLKSCQVTDEKKKSLGMLILPKGKFTGGPNWCYTEGAGYGHPIAAMAMAEAFGMTKDETLKEPAQFAVDYTVKVHQVPYSGWRYRARQKADLSATGWFVMQLKSAKVAGLVVDGTAFQGAMKFTDECTNEKGEAKYAPQPHGDARENKIPTPCMTAVGMVCRVFMGAKNDDPMLQGGAEYLRKYVPKWDPAEYAADIPKPGNKGFYYWYYGTLGMFQVGGDAWREWNVAMRDMLIKNQCTAEHGPDLNGSWDPTGIKSRVFSTAVGALCLEVYYRYLPMYGE